MPRDRKTMELILCVTFSSRGCSSLASLRSRSRIRQLSRVHTRVRRPSRRPPAYRIGTAYNQGNGAILAIVNSQPTSSVWRPRRVQAPTAAKIHNTFFRNSSEVTGHTVETRWPDRRRREAARHCGQMGKVRRDRAISSTGDSGKRELEVPPLGRSLLASLAVGFPRPFRIFMPKMKAPLRRAEASSRWNHATEPLHAGRFN
jgi:hypothetical protein